MAAKKHHDAKLAEEEGAATPPDAVTSEPPASGGLSPEAIDELKQLGELHEQGVLTDAEFEREKAKLLGS
jgi:hypothetical protein